MLETAFKPLDNLRAAARLRALSRDGQAHLAAEIGVMAAAGIAAALAIGLVRGQIRIPGHAILRAVLPLAIGLSLVPRRSAGSVMSICAGVTVGLLHLGGFGRFQPAAVVGLIAIGPFLDLAMVGAGQGWRLYVRFILAGIAANLLSYESRLAAAYFGFNEPGSRQFASFWLPAILSFALCGAIAGLIGAAACFRLRTQSEP
ncbi:MAG TPA: hypothetical protein VG826_28495 [Pirellulales bacterium]|nr:hypothetical protein [Pirellulales bacterium]